MKLKTQGFCGVHKYVYIYIPNTHRYVGFANKTSHKNCLLVIVVTGENTADKLQNVIVTGDILCGVKNIKKNCLQENDSRAGRRNAGSPVDSRFCLILLLLYAFFFNGTYVVTIIFILFK